ncbi:MAG: hypothetical protein ACTSVV_05575 [Promethearchaeota archaeon]
MSVSLDLDLIINNLVNELGSSVYFIIIASENGAVKKAYISDEFNKSSIALNVSQMYELAEEITEDIGIDKPDFNIIHSANYYILSIKILEVIIILLMEDQIEITTVFRIINNSIEIG